MSDRPPTPPLPESGPPALERRVARHGRLIVLWDLLFRGFRLASARAGSFYATVGIVLVAGVVLALIAGAAFAQLAEYVREGGTQSFDVAVLRWIGAHHTKFLTAAAIELTYLGTGTVVITIVGVSALFLWHTEHKHSARLLLASVAGGIILNNGLKLLFHRERPTIFEWQTSALSSSFPSGHAMSATVCYGTVAYLVSRLQKHRVSRIATLTGAAILILLICMTRLYLGVHYPSDVLGGIIVGVAWASFCMAVLEASLALARYRAPKAVMHEQVAAVEQSPG